MCNTLKSTPYKISRRTNPDNGRTHYAVFERGTGQYLGAILKASNGPFWIAYDGNGPRTHETQHSAAAALYNAYAGAAA